MAKQTGLVVDERYLAHLPGDGHPESADRLAAVYKMLDQAAADLQGCCRVTPRLCRRRDLLRVHLRAYVRRVAATVRRPVAALARDTPICRESYRTACLAVGGVVEAVHQVWFGRLANALALVRPPGHHAEVGRAMGYCLFNNVAAGAMYARYELHAERVLIVDWDVHHGNGTQHIFERDPRVLFFSSHQYPLYPGTGIFTEVGAGPGEGFTINLPLARGHGDAEYAALYDSLLRPVALEYRPDLILVSAGFDIHGDDPLGGMRVTPRGFAALTRIMLEIAEQCCAGRLVLVLEGGYRAEALADSVMAVMAELCGAQHTELQPIRAAADPDKVRFVQKRCIGVHGRYWRCLRS
jgi:acetoin utilization deacetylase AcuC-like enzyme